MAPPHRYLRKTYPQHRPGLGSAPPRMVVPATHPDYGALAKGTSRYMGWQAGAEQRRGNATANRRAAIRALILQYGKVPAGFKDEFGDVDPALLADAGASQLSQSAQLEQAFQKNLLHRRQGLVSRGMSDSGELGYEVTTAGNERATQENDLIQQLLAAARGDYANYTGEMAGINAEEPGVLSESMDQAAEMYPSEPESTAQIVPGSQESYGFPVYKTPDGQLYKIGPNGLPQRMPRNYEKRSPRLMRGVARQLRGALPRAPAMGVH
jgi:hypothetical protein